MIDKPWVAVTRAELPGDGLARLAERAQLRIWTEDRPPEVDELVRLIGDAPAALCANGDPITGTLLGKCPALKVVVMASVGYDSVDVSAASKLGIAVTNTPGVLAETVADLTFGLIIWARRGLGVAERYIRAGEWTDNGLWNLLGLDVHGTTIGIVGYGAIGRAVAARASGFGMSVIAHDTRLQGDAGVELLPLADLLRRSDVVSLHVPLTPETRGLIGERELRLMKPTATLVNTSRGGNHRPGCPPSSIARRVDPLGRPGRSRARTEPRPLGPAALAAQPRRPAAHRIGHSGGPILDGRPGRGQRSCVRRRQSLAYTRS